MSKVTRIGWTDSTWNPVRGCDKVSPGCKHCYAEAFSERFRGVPGHPFEQGFDLRLVPEKINEPLHWRTPRRIFVNSMSDLFHDGVPTAYIRRVCDVMMQASQHEYQILTKRDQRMKQLLSTPEFRDVAQATHIWWGVSVEDKKYGYPRVQALRETPVRNRFISCEPLVEDVASIDLTGIHWVIIGGESGGHSREFQLGWARALRDRCFALRIPLFVKQLGGKAMDGDTLLPIIDDVSQAKKDAHRRVLAHFPPDLQIQQWPGERMSEPAPLPAPASGGVQVPGAPITLAPGEMEHMMEWLGILSRAKETPVGHMAAAALSAMAAIVSYTREGLDREKGGAR